MDSSQPAPLGQPSPGKPSQTANKRPRWARTDRKAGRPSRKQIAGWLNWFNRCVRAGNLADAAEFHRKHGLHRYGAAVPPVPTAEPAPTPALPAPPAPATAPLGVPAYGAPATAPAPGSATHGGEGVDQAHRRDNWDKTTPAVQILQCSPVATAGVVPLAVLCQTGTMHTVFLVLLWYAWHC